MVGLQRKLLSQNFLHNRELVRKLIRWSSIGRHDTVVEIGSGKGIITQALARVCNNVIAIEIDGQLVQELEKKFRYIPNVTIRKADVRQYVLPSSPYKVFANIPFSITADVVYKLLYYSHPPDEAYLIVQKEAAQKFAGTPHENQFSILAKPWFEFKIVWHFKRSDFIPMPDVDCVLLNISKKSEPLVSREEEDMYKAFIKYAFNTWKKDLKVGLKRIFTYNQWKRLAKDNHFSVHTKPTDLSFEQWMAIFEFLQEVNQI